VLHNKARHPIKLSITPATQQDHKQITQDIAIYLKKNTIKNTLKACKGAQYC
jgi:hypothetical protein